MDRCTSGGGDADTWQSSLRANAPTPTGECLVTGAASGDVRPLDDARQRLLPAVRSGIGSPRVGRTAIFLFPRQPRAARTAMARRMRVRHHAAVPASSRFRTGDATQ